MLLPGSSIITWHSLLGHFRLSTILLALPFGCLHNNNNNMIIIIIVVIIIIIIITPPACMCAVLLSLSMMLRRNNNTIPPHLSLVALAPPAPMTRHRLLHYTHGSPYPWASTWPCHVECCSSLCPYPKSTHRPHLFTTLLLSGPRVSFGSTLEWGWRLKAMGKSRLPARSSRPVLFIYVLTCSGLDLFFYVILRPPLAASRGRIVLHI